MRLGGEGEVSVFLSARKGGKRREKLRSIFRRRGPLVTYFMKEERK